MDASKRAQALMEAEQATKFLAYIRSEYEKKNMSGIVLVVTPYISSGEIVTKIKGSAFKLDGGGVDSAAILKYMDDPTKSVDEKWTEIGNTFKLLRNQKMALQELLKEIEAVEKQMKQVPGFDVIHRLVFDEMKRMTPDQL